MASMSALALWGERPISSSLVLVGDRDANAAAA